MNYTFIENVDETKTGNFVLVRLTIFSSMKDISAEDISFKDLGKIINASQVSNL